MVQLESERELRIRSWVDNTLSIENDLVPGAFPLTEQIIIKQGNLCGRLYCLHGPRSVRLVAVHDFSTDRILTYDSLGNRTGERAVVEVLDENFVGVQ
jgi:hypothetical protein